MKKTKFIVRTFRLEIKCDEDELVRIFESISSGEPIVLRQGSFNPSTYEGIVPDDKWMRDFREDKKYQIRDKEIEEYPKYEDLFAGVRDQVRQLSIDKHPNKMIRGN